MGRCMWLGTPLGRTWGVAGAGRACGRYCTKLVTEKVNGRCGRWALPAHHVRVALRTLCFPLLMQAWRWMVRGWGDSTASGEFGTRTPH